MAVTFDRARQSMVEEQLAGRGISDARVLEAMRRVERHRFIDVALRDAAYEDKPLPIGAEQTISQPFMVALMTEALELRGRERVLEIGTGCGYQTAILGELAEQVFSIERLETLAATARATLGSLGYTDISIRVGDGTLGWPEEAPFDAILVTAGTPVIPRPLIEQLAPGGRLVFPMGEEELQTLIRIRKKEDGLQEEYLGECRFVPLVGRYGWER
jgi:protein-L-isoaspartate(D-aspartate) O-methyltransferase